jgi:cytochrome P450
MLFNWIYWVLALVIAWFSVRLWYFRLVRSSREKVYYLDGETVPGQTPQMLVGNLVDVYQADNRLNAYHSFHDKFGEIVQIFWMWRQQVSIANYCMALHVLISNQKNYQKFRPNSLIQRLYGSSVLTNSGDDWKRHRLLMNEVFSKQHIASFHDLFVSYSEQLAAKWNGYIDEFENNVQLNIYPELIALFLDIIGQTAIGHHFGALKGEADEFLANLNYVLKQSTCPAYQFTNWWKYLPLPANRKLDHALARIDEFFNELIRQKREMKEQITSNSDKVLDLLLLATNVVEGNVESLTDKEIRDNLLAIVANGHETVATSVSITLYFLARHPEKLARVQAEIDRAMEKENGQLTKASLLELNYLEGIIYESLRLCPPMAGFQRISLNDDILEGWSIPAKQVVGIALRPLHLNAQYYGDKPEQFYPERYLDREWGSRSKTPVLEEEYNRKCPMKWFHRCDRNLKGRTKANICLPLTFGEGARKCLGEHFAMYEMKVGLAVLLHRFDFQLAPDFEINLELGKFGLFISMFPKGGVEMKIGRRHH